MDKKLIQNCHLYCGRYRGSHKIALSVFAADNSASRDDRFVAVLLVECVDKTETRQLKCDEEPALHSKSGPKLP